MWGFSMINQQIRLYNVRIYPETQSSDDVLDTGAALSLR